MKLNQLKINLIKLDGVNVIQSKNAILDSKTGVVFEKKGFLFREKENYKIETDHIKRSKKGKMLIFIDMKTKKSINPHTSNSVSGKCQNCLGYLMQEKNWKARQQNKKIDRWMAIAYLFAGIGLFYLITQLVSIISGRI